MAQARNAPCPCGSKRKYKRCCGAPGATPSSAMVGAAVGSRWRQRMIWIGASAVGLGGLVGIIRGPADALAVVLAVLLGGASWLALYKDS